jgi:hypothetical protein
MNYHGVERNNFLCVESVLKWISLYVVEQVWLSTICNPVKWVYYLKILSIVEYVWKKYKKMVIYLYTDIYFCNDNFLLIPITAGFVKKCHYIYITIWI